MNTTNRRQSVSTAGVVRILMLGLLATLAAPLAFADKHDAATEVAEKALEKETPKEDDKNKVTGNNGTKEEAGEPNIEAVAAMAAAEKKMQETLKEADALNQELAAANKKANELLSRKTEGFSLGESRDYEVELGLLGVYKLNSDIVGLDVNNNPVAFKLGTGTRFRFLRVDENKPNDASDDEYWIQTDCSRIAFINGICNTVFALEDKGKGKLVPKDPVKGTKPLLLKVKKQDLAQGTFRLSNAIDHGVLLVPFKVRNSDMSLTGATTIGYFVGLRSDTLLGSGTAFMSVGTSLVPVERQVATSGTTAMNTTTMTDGTTAATMNGDAMMTDTNAMTTEIEEELAVSLVFGMAFSTKSNFQISVAIGLDHIGGSAGDAWEYEDDAWFSIGVGYGFLQR